MSASFLTVNPRYAERLQGLGLTSSETILDLPGEIISGHRDRHVVAVKMPGLDAILKREHRVPLGQRLRNWLDGFGWSSLSTREARILAELSAANVSVPEWIAFGADGHGREFLLLKRVRHADTLPTAIQGLDADERQQLAINVGRAVASVVAAEFTAPDLTAKHVLVRRKDRSIVLIDWPRARRSRNAGVAMLAGLHATLAADFVSIRDRLIALRACRGPNILAARNVERLAKLLHRHRSIREQLKPKSARRHRLRWLDGERLCVTRPLFDGVPDIVRTAARERVDWPRLTHVDLDQFGGAWLFQLPPGPLWRQWLASLRPLQAAACRQAGLAFRLERSRVPVSRTLAFGGQPDGGGFLLVQAPQDHRGLREWLALPRPGRRRMLHRLGRLLKQCHDAGCRGIRRDVLFVETRLVPRLRLVVDGGLIPCSRVSQRAATAELKALCRNLGILHRLDMLRVVRGYLAGNDVKSEGLRLASTILELSGAAG